MNFDWKKLNKAIKAGVLNIWDSKNGNSNPGISTPYIFYNNIYEDFVGFY